MLIGKAYSEKYSGVYKTQSINNRPIEEACKYFDLK
jgi:hypothetical protein